MDNSNLTTEEYEEVLRAKDYLNDYLEAIDNLASFYEIFQFSLKSNSVRLDSEIYYAFVQFRESVREYKKVIRHYTEFLDYFTPEIEVIQECIEMKNKLKEKVSTLSNSLKVFIKKMEKAGLSLPFPEVQTTNPYILPC